MPKKLTNDKKISKAMKGLGKVISECRENRSFRSVSDPCGMSASQLFMIENGTLAPTAEIYAKLLSELKPTQKQQIKMDKFYMVIRGTPPPDVCEIMVKNEALNDVVRMVGCGDLTAEQIEKIRNLITTFDLNQGEETNG
ncbi:MAG: hypothetical protein IKU42_05410 [Oscillospiraceae bacterium]|nr:hypothetical protein [Oscillospiraceae bacterium]